MQVGRPQIRGGVLEGLRLCFRDQGLRTRLVAVVVVVVVDFVFILRRMGKNKALAHHTSTYFHTLPRSCVFRFGNNSPQRKVYLGSWDQHAFSDGTDCFRRVIINLRQELETSRYLVMFQWA